MTSKTDYVLLTILFYGLLIMFLSFWGGAYEQSDISVLGVDVNIGIVGAIANLPVWINTILGLFTIFTAWLILSSILPSGS